MDTLTLLYNPNVSWFPLTQRPSLRSTPLSRFSKSLTTSNGECFRWSSLGLTSVIVAIGSPPRRAVSSFNSVVGRKADWVFFLASNKHSTCRSKQHVLYRDVAVTYGPGISGCNREVAALGMSYNVMWWSPMGQASVAVIGRWLLYRDGNLWN